MKSLIAFLIIISTCLLISQPKPSRTGLEAVDGSGNSTFSDTAIWHKNMELICPVNFDSSGQWNEMVEYVTIGKI